METSTTLLLNDSIALEQRRREFKEAIKPLSELEQIELNIMVSKLSGATSLTLNGVYYQTHFIRVDKVSYTSLDVLEKKYYMVRGFGFGGRGYGYTIVFNTDLKGIFNHYPR